MRRRDSTLYLQRCFTLNNPEYISVLDFMIDYDDGFKVWINSQEVLSVNVPTSLLFNSLASKTHESEEFETFEIPNLISFLKKGANLIAIQGPISVLLVATFQSIPVGIDWNRR
ncbi:hypothetical protein CMK14_00160 [Candidatus Poribacteria bacterium]|nr:hypothetical protein [Candidatus Poribacteria bacterium]